MDKTQDIIIMIGYGPLLGGLLLAVAFLAGSLYTQQGRLRGPFTESKEVTLASLRGPEPKGPLKEAQLTESDGLKGEGSVEDKQDTEDQDSAPEIRHVKFYQDIPKEYCCRAMKEGVEVRGFIEYYRYYDEYCFSSYDGYPLATMRYCPYCGKEVASLRPLFGIMQTQYMEERGWNLDQVYRYWDLYRGGKSQEEAERIVEQERRSLPPQE